MSDKVKITWTGEGEEPGLPTLDELVDLLYYSVNEKPC